MLAKWEISYAANLPAIVDCNGPQAYLLSLYRVANVLRPPDAPDAAPEDAVWDAIAEGVWVDPNATLETALPLFDKSPRAFIPVVTVGAEGVAHGVPAEVPNTGDLAEPLEAAPKEKRGSDSKRSAMAGQPSAVCIWKT